MNQRTPIDLSTEQTELSLKNRKYLAQNGIDYGLLSITQTGLNKSIMDAVGSLRTYLKISTDRLDLMYVNFQE